MYSFELIYQLSIFAHYIHKSVNLQAEVESNK